MEVRENRDSALMKAHGLIETDRSRAGNLNKSISGCGALIRSRKWQKEREDALSGIQSQRGAGGDSR